MKCGSGTNLPGRCPDVTDVGVGGAGEARPSLARAKPMARLESLAPTDVERRTTFSTTLEAVDIPVIDRCGVTGRCVNAPVDGASEWTGLCGATDTGEPKTGEDGICRVGFPSRAKGDVSICARIQSTRLCASAATSG